MDNNAPFVGVAPQQEGDVIPPIPVSLQADPALLMPQPKKPATKRPNKKSSVSKLKEEPNDAESTPSASKKTSTSSNSKSRSGSSKKKKANPKNQNGQCATGSNDNSNNANSQFGRWKPEDDYALITAVQQTCDLTSVYLGIRFSSRFSVREIQERWYTLLYDPVLSSLAKSAMQKLPVEVVSRIERETLFSRAEEALISTVPSNNQIAPPTEAFIQLLHSNPAVFHPSRSSYILLRHWQRLRRYGMLAEQQNKPKHEVDLPDPLIDSEEEKMAQGASATPGAPQVKSEDACLTYSAVAEHHRRRQIRRLESETASLGAVVESIVGISPNDFGQPQTLAVLRGRAVRFLIRAPEVLVGRNPSNSVGPQVAIDVSLEGPAWRVSRRQAVITMKSPGEFFIENVGKAVFTVESKPVLQNSEPVRLTDNSVIIMGGCLRFLFRINPELSNNSPYQQSQPAPNQGPGATSNSSENITSQFSSPVTVVMQNQQQTAGFTPQMNTSQMVTSGPPPNVSMSNVSSQYSQQPPQQRPVYTQQPVLHHQQQQPPHGQFSYPQNHPPQFPPSQSLSGSHQFAPPQSSPTVMTSASSSSHFAPQGGPRLMSPPPPPHHHQQNAQFAQQQQQPPVNMQAPMQIHLPQQHPH